MKKNSDFTIKNYAAPAVLLMLLILAAIWTNAGFEQMPSQSSAPAPLDQPLIPFPRNSVAKEPLPVENQASPQSALMVQEGISQVIAMVKPAVVGVLRMNAQTGADTHPGLDYLDPYQTGKGQLGSGVIIDRQGYVLTTFQAVGTDSQVKVIIYSGQKKEYMAQVIGIDEKTDLALLKLNANGVFPSVILGNSDLLEVGDIVLAVGCPFGFSRTVTMGIVSSTNRSLTIDGIRYPDMIQTDAAVNAGNNGGPLVNIKGEVVGINMATFMPDKQFAGIGFAIPINDILAFVSSIQR